MPAAVDPLNRLVRRAHRRRLAVRWTDAAWAAIVGGTGVAVGGRLLHVDAWPVVVVTITIAVTFALRRRPTPAETAAWLDRRYGTDDLLASAWLTSGCVDDPWTAALRSTAAARVAALPPLGRVARFGLRAHACTIAVVIALLLAMPFIRPSTDDVSSSNASAADRLNRPATEFAAVPLARPDTAGGESPARLPAPVRLDTAGRSTPRRTPGGDARGTGRADVDNVATDRSDDSFAPSRTASDSMTAGGSGRATAANDGPTVTGRVDAEPLTSGNRTAVTGNPRSLQGDPSSAVVKDRYRDLVREYFDR